ncbi:PrpF protein-domain-containing protein [Emericellopsis atlantica]|uniref:PrpF protein-domain-containing protein n=1 Tax=Emericellopsis atlantica TaxID=2614577 RepID=A0A9P7ZLR8_9HYPO|nr:PrpF protein-domain-containing protein [Emericellopsis atlantica]KAG9254453.1 PrpF protein-domain-containing protein [Emericellopsis atlantica]
MAVKTTPRRRCALPCALMRAGTSKGMFIHRKDLPEDPAAWAPHLISAMGSRCNDPKQLDGVGGGTSTTSKVAVVAKSTRPDADVDFTFVQVAVGKEAIDVTGTCGNIVSGVAPFAVQEGLVRPEPGQTSMDVRVYSTNTDRIVVETVALDEHGEYQEDGTYTIPGVSTSGSEVRCNFVDPAGSMTGHLFPSGERRQILRVQSPDVEEALDVRVSLVDAANPFVLIDAPYIGTTLRQLPSLEAQHVLVEAIRREGAVAMGLASSVEVASKTRGTPKVALVYPPVFSSDSSAKKTSDIRVQAYSMGLPHPSLQLTGAVCLASALCSPGTIVADLAGQAVLSDGDCDALPSPERTPSPPVPGAHERSVTIAHSKGTIQVGVQLDEAGGVRGCAVSRTARRLFEGKVRYYVEEA